MPCNMMEGITNGEIAAGQAEKRAKEAIDAANKVADMLCRVLRCLPPSAFRDVPPDVRAWMDEHEKWDAERKAKEARDRAEAGKSFSQVVGEGLAKYFDKEYGRD